MKRISTKKTAMLLIAAGSVFVIGCSAGGTITHTVKPTISLDTVKAFSVNVESKVADSEKEKTALLAGLMQKLKATGKWDVAENGQMKMNVEIIEINRVSQTARVLLGALAGKAKTKAEVTITRVPSGEKISQFTVEGESSGGSVFAGGTDESVDMAATKIVEAIGQK